MTGADAGRAELRAMVGRFAGVTLDWGMSDMEVEALVAADAGTWTALRALKVEPALEQETRMRRAIEVASLLASAIGEDAVVRDWLRRPHAAIVGRLAPLGVMCDREGGLRAMRDRLRAESHEATVPRGGAS